MKKFVNILISILVIAAGFIGIYLVNFIGTIILKSIFGSGITPEGIPLTENSRIVFLIILFVAGMVGAFIIAVLIKQKPWIHLGIFFALAIPGDIYAIQGQLAEFPLWAKIIILVSIPVQIWIGGKIGIMIKRK